MSGLSLETRVSNSKSVTLIVLELLAFNAQKFRGSRYPGHSLFWKKFKGRVPTVSGNTCVEFKSVSSSTVLELFAFNSHFKLARLTGPLRTQTQNHIERTHYRRHSLRSLGRDN